MRDHAAARFTTMRKAHSTGNTAATRSRRAHNALPISPASLGTRASVAPFRDTSSRPMHVQARLQCTTGKQHEAHDIHEACMMHTMAVPALSLPPLLGQ